MTQHTHPAESDCCRDFTRASLSRRSLLQGAAAVGGGMAVTQMFGEAMMQTSFAGTPGGNTMVVISLRGGVDGLGVVVPHGDPA
ncbi:MAG TPA: twin-arginine translocation signal domain-containing protein, partial [Microlunatus sp.]|nr:twin-arginine translocation signal domain-containing protein [Microlunatus sp.]